MRADPNSPLGVLVQLAKDVAQLLADMAAFAAQNQKGPLVSAGRSISERSSFIDSQDQECWHRRQGDRGQYQGRQLRPASGDQRRQLARLCHPAEDSLRCEGLDR